MGKIGSMVVALLLVVVLHSTSQAQQPQDFCDAARLQAWTNYSRCVNRFLVRYSNTLTTDSYSVPAKCRHTLFRAWAAFQNSRRRPSLVGTTCVGDRFVQNNDKTVTDNLTALVWEEKDALDDVANYADPHDADNTYTWSLSSAGIEDGTAFSDFLRALNSDPGFAGAFGWRLPTLLELQSIELDFLCTGTQLGPKCRCSASPCIEPALNANETHADDYISGTTFRPATSLFTWGVEFTDGLVTFDYKPGPYYVRAVRGGL